MLVRRLDDRHDMTFGRGLGNYATDSESVRQRVMTRLLLLLGEWFLDTSDGVPYLQEIMVKPANTDHARSIIAQRILDTEDVTAVSVLSFSFDHQTRVFTIQTTVLTAFDTSVDIQVTR